MRHSVWFSFAAILLSIEGCTSSRDTIDAQPGQRAYSFSREVTRTEQTNYLLYIPQGYEKDKKSWPLMFFLHGAGERGDSIQWVKRNGPPMIVEDNKDFPFILLSPQCPQGEGWSNEKLSILLDDIVRKYRVDTDRIYLTGLSMGGFGTWSLAIQHPEKFAAIAPICGGGNPDAVRAIKNVPTWVFHGARDNVVPIEQSEEMVTALKACGGDVKFTVYPEAGHNSWTAAYNDQELYKWFLSHRRSTNQVKTEQK